MMPATMRRSAGVAASRSTSDATMMTSCRECPEAAKSGASAAVFRAAQHARQQRAAELDRRQSVHQHDLGFTRRGIVDHAAEPADPRIVDHEIDRRTLGRRGDALASRRLGEVGDDGAHHALRRGQLLGQRLQPVAIAPRQQQLGRPRQGAGESRADAAGCAGDQGGSESHASNLSGAR